MKKYIKYGLISEVDARCIEKTIDLIINRFPDETIRYTEVGLYNGRTISGIREYLKQANVEYRLTGIDNFKDGEKLVFFPDDAVLIEGSSIDVYDKLEDNSQHLIFVDGNHTFPYVVADFYCYSPKVKTGGYMAFHDTAAHTQIGDISVRKALGAIGLFDLKQFSYSAETRRGNKNWELIFEEADPNDTGGGICVFKRLY